MALSRFVLPFADVGSGIRPSSGAQLFFLETGTSTPANTYNCPDGTTANSNPVIADSKGLFPDIFLSGTFKVILQDRNDVQQWEADPVEFIRTPDEVVDRVDTVAALRLLEPVSDGQSAFLVGHTVQGIGGGDFYYDASDSASADNNGTVIVTTGGKRWKRPNVAGILATWFGAIGDGAVDDTAAIQSALNTLTDKSSIVFSDGDYLCGAISLTNVDNVIIKGMSAKLRLIGKFTITDCIFLSIKDLTIEEEGFGRTLIGLQLITGPGFLIDNATIGGFSIGVDSDGNYKSRITNCNISGNDVGIKMRGTSGTTSDNVIANNIFGSHFVYCIQTSSAITQISNNTFESVQDIVADIYGDTSAKNMSISGNSFFDGAGIKTEGTTISVIGNTFNECYNSTENKIIQFLGSGNTCTGNAINFSVMEDDTAIYATGELVVSGNWIKRAIVAMQYDSSGALTFTGNHVVSSTGGASIGVKLTSATQPTIVGNEFAALGSFAIQEISSVTNGIYSDNNLVAVNGGGDPYSILASAITSSRIDLIYAGAPTLNAGRGSIYHRTDGGTGTCFYVREDSAWIAK